MLTPRQGRGDLTPGAAIIEEGLDLKLEEQWIACLNATSAPKVSDELLEAQKGSNKQSKRRIRLSDELMHRGDSASEAESADDVARQTSGEDEWEDY